jgi:beta-phosphoglucomutase
MSKGVIFDFDGVIAETEPLQLEAYNRLLTQFGAPPLTEMTFIREYIGLPTPKIIDNLRSVFAISAPLEELTSLKESLYEEIIHSTSLEPMPGLVKLLEQLRSYEWKLAIASSSPSTTLHRLLVALHIDKYFWPILSSDSVAKGKPAPDIYELAASRLDVDKDRIVVIEDSQTGFIAAKQAGLKCVVVPNRFTREHDFSGCALLVGQLADITHARLMSLIQSEVVYVPKSESGYCQVLFNAIHNACVTKHTKLILKSPKKDEDIHSQLVELEELARCAPDALILVPIDDTSDIRRILSSIARQGITVVTLDQKVNVNAELGIRSSLKSFSVAADCQRGGELAAETLLDAIGYQGTIAIVSGPRDLKPSKDRRLGFLGYVASYAPRVRLEMVRYTNWYKEEGSQVAEDFIKQGIKLDGIFCACDNLAIGAANTYQSVYRNGRDDLKIPAIVGFGGIPEIYEYILDDCYLPRLT